MKKNILIISLLAIGLYANAQVGINTNTPEETLHVNGTFRLDNNTKGAGKVLVSDANGTGTWQTVSTGGTGSVTNVSGTAPISVINNTTTPVISLNNSGVTAGTYNGITVNEHGIVTSATAITPAVSSLTTTGTSGVATLNSGVLNIPNYTYTLPIATTTLGGVKNGGNVTINTDGTMSAPAAGTATSVNVTLPITNTGTPTAPTIGLSRNNILAGASSNIATAPLTLDAGATNAVVGGANATLTVNNTAALWNANKIQGTNVSTAVPTNNQVLQYNSSTSQYVPTALPTASNDWKLVGNAGIADPGALGSASTNFVGTTDDKALAFATNNVTRAVLDTQGTLNGGGSANSSLAWGTENTLSSSSIGSSIALGKSNNASVSNNANLASIAIGNGNTATNGGKAFGGGNKADGNITAAVGYNNTVGTSGGFSGGYAFGAGNVTQGYSFGSGNIGVAGTVTIGITTTASTSGESVYGNTKHLFYNQSNATTTNVGINVPTAAATADLTVKETIRIAGAYSTAIPQTGARPCTNPGTIVFQSDIFWGCTSTGWKALNN